MFGAKFDAETEFSDANCAEKTAARSQNYIF
jgi:hypothetical protein